MKLVVIIIKPQVGLIIFLFCLEGRFTASGALIL